MSDIRQFMKIISEAQTLEDVAPVSETEEVVEDMLGVERRGMGADAAKPPVLNDHPPALGIKFTYKGTAHVVTGYMRTAPQIRGTFGKRDTGLVACRIDQAEYVIGMGGHGCVAPISQITPTGEKAQWSHEQRQHVEKTAMDLVDRAYTIKRPAA